MNQDTKIDEQCPACTVKGCSQMWHDYYWDTKHADFEDSNLQAYYKAGYEKAYERVAEKDAEINLLKEELNNSKMFHCPHFVTTDNGYIDCNLTENAKKELELKDARIWELENKLISDNQKLRDLVERAKSWVEKEYVPDIDIEDGQRDEWLKDTEAILGGKG